MCTIYSVFGNPVLHSKSPQLFGPLLQNEHALYTRIRPQSAEDMVNVIRQLNIRGASITSPFKESVLPLVDHLSQDARGVGAVNCIRQSDGNISGHNTDHNGVSNALSEAGLSLKGAEILVLGAGGAARAAVYGLVSSGAKVTISNRTYAKAKALADMFGCQVVPWEHPGRLPGFDAVVSALLPEALPPFIENLSYGILLDAIYKPSEMTAFSREKGIPVIGGERWLIHQGVEAAAFYIGQKPSPDILVKRLEEKPDKDSLRIFVLNEHNSRELSKNNYDLVVSAFGLDNETVKQIIEEEKTLAYGG